MDTVVRPVRTTARSRTSRALTVTAVCVAGVAVFTATRADAVAPAAAPVAAAPATSTGDLTMTAATTSALRGDSGNTFYLDSYAWGVQVPVTRVSGRNTPQPGDQTLTLSRPVGLGSATLLSTMAAGRRLSTIDITVNAKSPQRAYAAAGYRLQNCLISDLRQGADADGRATEKVSILCETSTLTTRATLPNGQLSPDSTARITSSGNPV